MAVDGRGWPCRMLSTWIVFVGVRRRQEWADLQARVPRVHIFRRRPLTDRALQRSSTCRAAAGSGALTNNWRTYLLSHPDRTALIRIFCCLQLPQKPPLSFLEPSPESPAAAEEPAQLLPMARQKECAELAAMVAYDLGTHVPAGDIPTRQATIKRLGEASECQTSFHDAVRIKVHLNHRFCDRSRH